MASLHCALPATTRLGWFARCKRDVANAIMESRVLRMFCCLNDSDVQQYQQDVVIRTEIRESMRQHMGFGVGKTCIEQTMQEVYTEMKYDLSDFAQRAPKLTGVRKTMAQWDMLFTRCKLDPLKLTEPQVQFLVARFNVIPVAQPVDLLPTCVVPKFAASMCLMLRSKLGRLATNEANILLVEKEYLRVARNLRVRDVDIVAHQQHVVNAVFSEQSFERIALSRNRIPRWLMRLHGTDKVDVRREVC